jgi:hypothetical protein
MKRSKTTFRSNGAHNRSTFGSDRISLTPKRFVGALAMCLVLATGGRALQAGPSSTPPSVVSSSIANGTVLPAGNLTEVVTFNEPMNTSLPGPSAVSLSNTGLASTYSPACTSDTGEEI